MASMVTWWIVAFIAQYYNSRAANSVMYSQKQKCIVCDRTHMKDDAPLDKIELMHAVPEEK